MTVTCIKLRTIGQPLQGRNSVNTENILENQAPFAHAEVAVHAAHAITDDASQYPDQQGRMRVWVPLLCAAAVLHTALIVVA